jgi:tRNA nucleotidyltransferase (CCA-adding enzyme)
MDDEELRRGITASLRDWPGWEGLSRVISQHPGFRIFALGGSIRDVLLKRSTPSKDFDFIVHGTGSREAVQSLSEFGRLTYGPFGSARWYPQGSGVYADIANAKDWTSLWPCKDILDVLNACDFTANAIAYDLRNGHIVDPQNGRRDIARRQMRAVRFDFPDRPVSSTCPLSQPIISWFRLLHYAHKLDMTIEPVTLQWLVRHRSYLSRKAEFSTHFFEPQLDRLPT